MVNSLPDDSLIPIIIFAVTCSFDISDACCAFYFRNVFENGSHFFQGYFWSRLPDSRLSSSIHNYTFYFWDRRWNRLERG